MPRQIDNLLMLLPALTLPSLFVLIGRNDKNKLLSEKAVLLVIQRIEDEAIVSSHGASHQFNRIQLEAELAAVCH